MTDVTPTTEQRVLLDVLGNVPSGWDFDVSYPSHPTVTHRFGEFPELRLTKTTDSEPIEVAVRAVITDEPVFHGYVVTTTYPEPALLSPDCRERRLTSLSHDELTADGVSITHHDGAAPSGRTAVEQSLSLSAGARLAGYYADTLAADAVTVEESSPSAVSATDD